MSAERIDELLRRALLGQIDDPAEVAERDIEQIQRAVDGELTSAELDEMLGRVLDEPALARAWAMARRLRAELAEPSPAAAARSTLRWLWGVGAAAATVVAALWLAPGQQQPPVERAPVRPAICAAVQDSAALPREDFRLVWEPLAAGTRYTVEVFGPDLTLVDRAAGLDRAMYLVAADRLARLESGAFVYWRVEALLPSGDRLTSPTFVQHVE